MVNSLVWNKKSIIDLTKDTMISSSGDVSVENANLILGAHSSAKYSYTYNTSNNTLQTDNLRFILDVMNTNTSASSRYDESVQVEVSIQSYKQNKDEYGNDAGYTLGGTNTIQLHPYFIHETEGYTNTYDIDIPKDMIVLLDIEFINESENRVGFITPRLFNSMEIMDAIDEYGGGTSGGGGEPPLIEDLMMYSTTGEYSINDPKGDLTLEVLVPDQYLIDYSNANNRLDLTWTITRISGSPVVTSTLYYTNHQVSIEGIPTDFTVVNQRCVLRNIGGNGQIRVRVEINNATTIYAEKIIDISNSAISDMELVIQTPSGNIEGNQPVNAYIKVLPEMTRSGMGGLWKDTSVYITSYDGQGEAILHSGGEYLTGGIINMQLKGAANGKVKITVEVLAQDVAEYQVLFPSGFRKEFIVDVINVPLTSDLYTLAPNGLEIDSTKDYIDIIVGNNLNYYLQSTSGYGITSLDGQGKASAQILTGSRAVELTYRIYPVATGKINFWVDVHYYLSGANIYLGRIDVEINIKSMYKELKTELSTNTGLFEINDGAGQLEVYCTPNYSYHGGYSFSTASIDGGSINIVDKGDYALVTANKNGRAALICTPVNGKPVQCEIAINNQYPEDVELVAADDIYKVAIGGNLNLYAEPGNVPNPSFDAYGFTSEKLDTDVNFSMSSWAKYTKLTGVALGKFRIGCTRNVDNRFMTSRVIKVVQTLDNDKTVIPLPADSNYWCVFRRPDMGNRLWLVTVGGTAVVERFIRTADNKLTTDGVVINLHSHYRIEQGAWWRYGSWTANTTVPANPVGLIYASNLDIYDEAGNLLLAKTENYDDVDFNKIIYGE